MRRIPFRTIEASRIPIEDAKPVVVFAHKQEKEFLEACDAWQFLVVVWFQDEFAAPFS
jgi:hypothetical protein